jgi:hypothetical protein
LPDAERSQPTYFALFLTLILVVAAGAASLLAVTPTERLQSWGEVIRRADDVTPDRVFRFRLTCSFFGIVLASLGWCVLNWSHRLQQFAGEAQAEFSALPSEVRRWWESLSISNRISYLLIVATGAALRLKFLQTPMAYDEAYSFTNFARRPLVEALSDFNNTNNHLLNTFFMHVMYRLFGQQEWALRLPVLIAGIALVAVVLPWARARIGAAPALVATALVAASPMLIDYSVNARGYTYMTLFAVLLDGCFLRLATSDESKPRGATWIVAGLCVWLGFFAMLTFVHPLAGLVVWFAFDAGVSGRPLIHRLRSLSICLLIAGVAVAVCYVPAFIFRGTLALQNDFIQPLPFGQWMSEFPTALWKGIERWIAGAVPAPLLLVFAWGGVVAWIRRVIDDRRSLGWGAFPIAAMLLVPLALMALQRVAPPPRLFFFQAPWFYLLVAVGVSYAVGLLHRLKVPLPGDGVMRFTAYAVLAAAVWFAFEHAILREPHQREFGVGSVPAVLQRLATLLPGDGPKARLFSPLPCDHPSIYYASKHRVAFEINGSPQQGERLFLIARPGDAPESTLRDVVVKQEAIIDQMGTWNEVAKFPELTLWEASRRFDPTDRITPARPPSEKAP